MSCIQKGVEMEEKEIRKYAELMKELELTGLEITVDNGKVRLERSIVQTVPERAVFVQPAGQTTQPEPENTDEISIKSPIVGVFYASPAENADAYVKVGDPVQKGQTLCIVEAMKLMNEITAEEEGVISKVCVPNGQVVEYGTELFRMKR